MARDSLDDGKCADLRGVAGVKIPGRELHGRARFARMRAVGFVWFSWERRRWRGA